MAHHLNTDKSYEVAGFFDDTMAFSSVDGIPILGDIGKMSGLFSQGHFDSFMIAIGYKHLQFRRQIFETLAPLIPAATFVHFSSYVDSTAKIGPGSFVLPGCVLDRHVEIGQNVLLNVGCVIGHDSKVNDHSFVGPALACAGFCEIGKSCVIGINTTVIDNIVIGDEIKTGGGSVVVDHLREPGLYFGVPAKRAKST